MDWEALVEYVTPYVVKIETPNSHGTGFVCSYDITGVYCGIATAYHVVADAIKCQQPIVIHHFPTGNTVSVLGTSDTVFVNQETDTAIIMMPCGEIPLPSTPIPFLPADSTLPIGANVGWLGYPGLLSPSSVLCFFSGFVSAHIEERHQYLIDGVAINGVSGGPVFYSTPVDGVRIVGTITAYFPNRAIGVTLPGLSMAQDVSHFIKTLDLMKRRDEQYYKSMEQRLD